MQTMAESHAFASTARSLSGSKPGLWAGRVLSGVAVLFLLFDSLGKLLRVQPVIDGTIELGYPVSTVFGLGVTLLLCVIAYVIPRTSVLGAVLLTGYLGGAIATHVRVQNPLFTHVLFPVYVAMFIWGGLVLRDVRLRAFLPWRGRDARERSRRWSANKEKPWSRRSRKTERPSRTSVGKGPALILVDGALCSRQFGPMPKLAPLLAPHFTVYMYDRRGRGQSADRQPYSREREVEDIAALITRGWRFGVSPRAVVGSGAGAGGRGVRSPRDEGCGVRAAVRR